MGDRDDKVRGAARLQSDLATVDLHGEKKPETQAAASAFDRPVDRFETVGELGRGGMGRVDDAYDRALGRPVAIKHMLSQSALDFARFEREARITARLEHPGIVPIHEAGRSADGTPYYVMRRVDGRPLSEIVADRPFSERVQLVPNVLAACDAVGFAHARGIVHRDIKPTNILIGPFGETLLIDWGLARELGEGEQAGGSIAPSDQNLTRAGTVAGTPGFMAPEQARGENVDQRADVYALGATLFFVLTGKLPWGSSRPTELVNLAGTGREPDWNLLPNEAPPDLRAIVVKAMAADPAQRYPDAGAFAADLRRFTLGNLVAAYDYGPVAKLVRFARRHRAAVAVAAVSVAVLAIVAVISVRRIVAERDDANTARALAETRQREATAMADDLLVAHARELAGTDPAAAIAALRRLRPESTRWREAWAAAATAWLRGVPIGFMGPTRPSALLMSPDNRTAISLTFDTGELLAFDLVARTRREVRQPIGRTANVAWLDKRHIVCELVDQHALGIIDIANGELTIHKISVAGVYGSGERVWIETDDGTLLVLTDPQRPAKPWLTGVSKVFAAPDLRSAVFVRKTGTELWVDGRTFKLSLGPGVQVASVRDGVFAILDGERLHGFKVVDGNLVELGHWPRDAFAYDVRVIMGAPALVTYHTIRSYAAFGIHDLERMAPKMSRDSVDGFIAAMPDGRIVVRDKAGRFELGPRPLSFTRVDLSADGRWAVALSTNGEVLAWDLGQLRPQRLALMPSDDPMMIEGNSLWVHEMSRGFTRYDLATGRHETLLSDVPPPSWRAIGNHGSYIGSAAWGLGQMWIRDLTQNKTFRFDNVVRGAHDGSAILMVTTDAALDIWRPGDAAPRRIAKLAAVPDFIVLADRFVLARMGKHGAHWIDVASGREETQTMPEEIQALAMTNDGETWMISGNKAYAWHPGSRPTRIETPGRVDDVQTIHGGIVFKGPTSVVISRGGSERVVPVATEYLGLMRNDEMMVYETPQQDVGLLDLTTGSSVIFPHKKPIGGGIAADDTRVAYREPATRETMSVAIWTIRVPRDPAQFRAWLATVTNAKAVPNSDAVAY